MKRILYKFDPYDPWTLLLRMISLLVTILTVVYFKINPFAFSLILILAVSFLIFSRNVNLVVYESCFVVKYTTIFRLFQKEKIFNFIDIKRVVFVSGYKNTMKNLTPNITVGLDENDKVEIEFKNGEKTFFFAFGRRSEIKNAVFLINDLILPPPRPRL
ncbi:MAG: hypothetical protein JXA53_04255 [Bacteroidales bacterium]|nr:hypothetical protein [Bacteroidales bacterium]